MVQIIAGKKGKGKTKHLLDMANAAIKGPMSILSPGIILRRNAPG